MPDRRAHWRPRALTGTPPQRSLRVTNALGSDGGAACIYLYGPIDAMGAEWGGISAVEFVDALNSVQASRVELRVSSPGGDFWEATVMRAALVRHPATVAAYVDGLAASAASVLITGADRVVMARGSQQMVHSASSLAIGNAADLRTNADLLEKVDRDIAGFYLERSGQGTLESWLAVLAAETWYSAEEAVAAGLADEVAADPVRTREAEQVPVAASADHWILATYRYAGRGEAPSPVTASRVVGEHGPELTSVGPGAPVEPAVEPEPVAAEDDQPAPLTAPLLDDDAVARIAEAVAERLAQRTPELAPSEGTPETPAAVAAAAPPPATPAEPPTPQLPAAWDPHLIRNAIRKAAAT